MIVRIDRDGYRVECLENPYKKGYTMFVWYRRGKKVRAADVPKALRVPMRRDSRHQWIAAVHR